MKTMNTFNRVLFATALLVALSALSFGQTAMTTTTLTSSVSSTATVFPLASVTGVVAPSAISGTRTVLYIDRSAYFVQAVNGLLVTVTRGVKGTEGRSAHQNGAVVYVGPDRNEYFTSNTPVGACTASTIPVLPKIEITTGKAWTCTPEGRWGVMEQLFVHPSDCSFIPTTLTTTNILTQVGASGHMVVQGTSNAAAGTNTLTCNIYIPTDVATNQGAYLYDINVLVGSQTTAPTSVGTATLGSVTYPVANTTETASVEIPVALVGGAVTTVTPTALTTVTTAGRFLTIGNTFASPIRLNTDLQHLIFQFPFLQSAAAAMILNSPGLAVHIVASPNIF